MAVQSIILHLPEVTMQRAKQLADALQRPVEEVLTAMVTAARSQYIPPSPD